MNPTSGVWGTSDWLAASCGTVVKVWTPNDPASEIKLFEGTAVYSIDFSRNNRVIAVAGDKAQVVVYSNKPQGQNGSRAVGTFPQIPQEGIDAITCVRFSPNDAHLVAGCKDGAVHIWALRAKEGEHQAHGLQGSATSVAVSPNMEVLASSSTSGQVLLHDFKTGAKWKALVRSGPGTGNLSFSRVAPTLAAGNAAGQLLIFDIERMEKTEELPVHKGAVTGLSFSEAFPDLLLSCGSDGAFRCTDRRTKKAVWSVAARNGASYTALSAKHDGNMVAVGTTNGAVLVHDIRAVNQAQSVQHFSDTSSPVTAVRWQHLHQSKSSQKATTSAVTSSAVSAAAPTVSVATSSAAVRQQQTVQSQRIAPPAAAAGASNAAAAFAGVGASTGMGKSPALSEVSSASASADLAVRAFSPVQMYESADVDSADAAQDAAGVGATSAFTPQAPAAAAPGSSLVTPVQSTPADSTISGPGGAFMFTPGIGLGHVGLNSAPNTPVIGGAADITPVSRPAGVNSLMPPHVPESAAPAAAAAGDPGRLGRRNSISSAVESKAAAAATGRAGGRVPLPSSAASAAATNAAAGTAAAAIGSRGVGSRSNSSASLSTAVAGGSRPSSRPGTAGAAAGSGSSRRLSKAPSDTAENAAAAAAAATATGTGSRPSSAEAPSGTAAAPPAGASATSAVDVSRAAEGPSSRPGSAAALASGVSLGAAGGVGLREDVFKAYVDQQMAELRQDVKNMHLDMLRQFHQAQMDLVSVVGGLAQRQDQLAEAVAELAASVQGLRTTKQHAGIGMMPWI